MLPLEASAPVPASSRRLLAFGPFTFDPERRLLRRDLQEVTLPPRVLGVLEILVARAGDIVPRQELIDGVWKDAFVTDTSLAEAVSVLRQALGDDPQAPTYIQTVHRRGYRFVAPVDETHLEAAPAARAGATVPVAERVSPSIGLELVPWTAAAILFCVAAIAVWQATHATTTVIPASRFTISPSAGTRFDTRAPALAIAPDGSTLAWSACDASGCRLYVRPLDRLDATPVAGTEDARAPFFAPDGRSIGFFAESRLQRVSLSGGAPVAIADVAEPLGGVWTTDGRIIYAGSVGSGLLRVAEQGGTPEVLTTPRPEAGEVRHTWPCLTPDGRFVLFTIETIPGLPGSGRVGVLPAGRGAAQWTSFLSGTGIVRAPAGDTLLVNRGPDLQAVMFDGTRVALAGAPSTVASGLLSSDGVPHVAVSSTGTIVYAPAAASSNQENLSWWSPDAGATAVAGVQRFSRAILSPDGTRVARADGDGTRADIWVADVERGATTRLTHEGVNAAPVWSADSRVLFFASRTTGPLAIWRRDADASSAASRVYSSEGHAWPAAASPDGRSLAFIQVGGTTRSDIWLLPLDGSAPRALVQSPFDDAAPAFSPDSSLVAYQSAEAGRWDVYVQRLSDGRREIVSSDGGAHPIWSRDGRTLYYEAGDRLMRVTVEDGPTLRVGRATQVLEGNGASVAGIAPDGRFLLDKQAAAAPEAAIVATDWIREVRRLLGPPTAQMPR